MHTASQLFSISKIFAVVCITLRNRTIILDPTWASIPYVTRITLHVQYEAANHILESSELRNVAEITRPRWHSSPSCTSVHTILRWINAPSSFQQPTPRFRMNRLQKQVKVSEKMSINGWKTSVVFLWAAWLLPSLCLRTGSIYSAQYRTLSWTTHSAIFFFCVCVCVCVRLSVHSNSAIILYPMGTCGQLNLNFDFDDHMSYGPDVEWE